MTVKEVFVQQPFRFWVLGPGRLLTNGIFGPFGNGLLEGFM